MFLFRRFTPLLLLSLFVLAPRFANSQPVHHDGNLILRSMDSLGRYASFHTNFTFDKPMLRELGRGLPNDEDTQRILANLSSVTVHVYRYQRPGLYAAADVNALRAQYRLSGWQHLVAAGPKVANPTGRTDLWVRYENGHIEAITVLVMKPRAVNLVEVEGTLSPLDILHLRGHFGIPRFSGNHFRNDSGRHFLAEKR